MTQLDQSAGDPALVPPVLRISGTGKARTRAGGPAAPAPPPADASLRADLEELVAPDRVLTRPIDLVRYASDGSFYRLLPRAVVLARDVDEVRSLFAYSRRTGIPLTFRAAGTSLSGQAQSDGLLVEVARYWRGVAPENDGAQVRVAPGTIAARVNLALREHGRKIGPDPASITACTVGGILANNSSGMCCGVDQNAYHTLRSLTFVLPSGTVVDSAAPGATERFAAAEPVLASGLVALREEILADVDLLARVRAKYRMKNTTGYGLNALVDYSDPLDIFVHLLVGSEGTLAFLAEAVLDTVPELPHRVTALLVFPDLHSAGAAIVPLRDSGATAIELMDRASLRAVEDKPGVPPFLPDLPEGAAALLVDFATDDPSKLDGLAAGADRVAQGFDLLQPADFTRDAGRQAQYWLVRSGLFTSVGAARASGTSVLLEDVTVPVDRLADAVVDLTALFTRHGYDNGVVFGHAKDGNLHFLVTQSLNEEAEVERYGRFMDDLVDVVVHRYDGALKGEHGTGRNIAPFVVAEWGETARDIMRRLKDLADPEGVLNPGVIVNDDPRAHLRNLKTTPTIEHEADRCIECGYCEHVCPSRELTTTPRQRIVIRREMVRQANESVDGSSTPLLDSLRADYEYMGLETCAGDGMCEIACPVDINTGELVKRFRHQQHTERAENVGRRVAEQFGTVERLARLAVKVGRASAGAVGDGPLLGLTGLLRSAVGEELVPSWDPAMPKPAPARLPLTSRANAEAVYLPACINRIFGAGPDDPPGPTVPEALVALARRAGVGLTIPDDVRGTCCATPWHSKGYTAGAEVMANRTIERAWRWSERGRIPVVVDASSCTAGLRDSRGFLFAANAERFDAIRFVDSVDFCHDALLPRLRVDRPLRSVAVHAVCSLHHMQTVATLEALARAVAPTVVNPADAGCCAFAGDRGWLHPELTASATREEAAALAGSDHDAYVCSNRTCEVGLQRATGKPYRSVVLLLEEATRGMELPAPV